MSARPIASICCSPPDSVPAFWLLALLEPREELEDALQVVAERSSLSARWNAPISRFSVTVMPREDARALRALRDAHLHDLVRGTRS